MAFEHYLRSGSRLLRCGYTTGSCAALAASGAAQLLLSGHAPETLRLVTPKGIPLALSPAFCRMEGEAAVCAVRKDAGDDPDVTDGLLVVASVRKTERGIRIDGGTGVGRVTRPGLDQPVGAAAINTVPRQMIRRALEEVCGNTDYAGGLALTVSVPGGELAAKKTFNPQLGIEGGISILGTTGIVEPMSEKAIVDTVALEIRQAAANGSGRLLLTPGNYGMAFLDELHLADGIGRAKCSNYIGDALDIAALEGMREVLLVGHIGKLVKLAGGIMNTHSRAADCRRELFCAHAALCGGGPELCRQLMRQNTSDSCLAVLEAAGLREAVTESLLNAIQSALDRRSAGAFQVGALLFSNERGFLGITEQGAGILQRWQCQAQGEDGA